MEKCKQVAIEILTATSIHGIPSIIRTKRNRIRILWILFFLASFALCSYLVIQSILDYLKYEVTTKIRTIYEFPGKFPIVTICNSNPFTTNFSQNFLEEILKNNSINNYLNSSLMNELFPSELNGIYNKIEISKYLAQSYAVSDLFSEQEKRQLGYSIDEVVLSCIFAGANCELSEFTWTFDFRYGNCFSFNIEDSHLITRTSKIDGLVLELFVGVPEYIQTFTMNSGAVVFLSNNSISVSSLEGLELRPGSETSISVNRVFSTQLKKPYSNCDLEEALFDSYDSELYRMVFKMNKTYNQRDCYDLCYQSLVLRDCNCYDLMFMALKPTDKPCLALDEIICLFDVFFAFGKMKINEICDVHCPLECDVLEYEVTTSVSEYPSQMYSKILSDHPTLKQKISQNQLNKEFLSKNVLKVNIFYDNMKYTTVNEFPTINIISLLSGIGGTI